MELKFLDALNAIVEAFEDVSIVPLWNWNYHLRFIVKHLWLVSIVPLWNWNNNQYRLQWWRVRFQSYLYGIEIYVLPSTLLSLKVSIVPLWNWNTLFPLKETNFLTVSIVPLWNWNIGVPSNNDEPPRVSIVPLWNWNKLKPVPLSSQPCFNRTFMELK